MCGLAVIVSFDGRPADRHLLGRMAAVLQHRGPDDSGFAIYGPVGFAFRRLAILDLSPAGHQPMETIDGRLSVVFNGEIYNYIELKRELEQLGHEFRTACDTEVLLASYRQWGADCVSRFNGMWAFVIYDTVRRTLFASRDRFGVKPLYRYRSGQTLVFASEVKAIVASGLYQPAINWHAASKFLVRGRQDDDETFYEGINQLPAGTTLEIDAHGNTTERTFWSLQTFSSDAVPEFAGEPEIRFRELFEDAIRLRMRSDVPVGVCLSGGLDSNAIISVMADLRPTTAAGRLQAFSYAPEEFGEAPYLQASIARTGAERTEVEITPQRLWDVLPAALWHYDAPVHSASALVGFELMRLARSRGVKVVLSGQGADEVNAGYPSYFRNYWSDLVLTGRLTKAWREVSAHSAAHGTDRLLVAARLAGFSARRALALLPGYASLARAGRIRDLRSDAWYTPALIDRLVAADAPYGAPNLENALRYAVERHPLPLYLRVEDRNSMAHSVEARLPFLDYRLVSLAFSLPAEWKLRGPWNKFILREATKGVMPEGVRTRLDKMGFPQPSRDWFAGPWYEPMRDLLASQALRESGIVDLKQVGKELDRHRAKKVDVTHRLFHLAQFGVWLESASSGRSSIGRFEESPSAVDTKPTQASAVSLGVAMPQ